jgi:enamine deaminase RidA (YjgF/YER057c/UK114 family)/GNAT superfamily N-acetyltransferase
MRRLISSGSEFEAVAGYSRAVVDGEWVHVAGTTGFDYGARTIANDVVRQAEQAFDNIEAALGEAGATLADVVRARYYITEAADFERVAPVFGRRFAGIRPAATCVVCGLVDPRMRIEIEVAARLRQGRTERNTSVAEVQVAESDGPVAIRLATPADAALMLDLVRALARFEKQADAVKATVEDILREGFGERPAFECLVAELDGRAAGFAVFFHNYSTWTGRKGLYLEDIFVHEWARGRGVGDAMMRALARLALDRGCGRLDLAVLDWNPARAFYERLGFRHMNEWLPYRIDGAGLRRLAEGRR